MRSPTTRNAVMSKWMLLIIVIMLAAGSTLTASASSVRHESHRYIAGEVGTETLSCLIEPNIGGACFQADYGETKVTVTITDDKGWLVGGQIRFYDPVSRFYGYKLFCGTTTADIPWGAGYVLVYVNGIDAIIDANWGCFLQSHPSTNGTISADFITPTP